MNDNNSSGMRQPFMKRPHVVIVGAGASLAACPSGDKQGRPLPLMNNIIELVELGPVLDAAGIEYEDQDFEAVYSDLVTGGGHPECVQQIEQLVFEYFAQLQLPDQPTLYDHLVLSLREKDVVATFNWDPFLVQAQRRNSPFAPMPLALFLHGNVAIGHCFDHDRIVVGSRGQCCKQCGQPLADSRLLYPVSKKDYSSDPFIRKSWAILQAYLDSAYLFTIFGYSAPVSDVEAISLMKRAWGDPDHRSLEEVEIIDKIKSEDELCQAWSEFNHSHHYRTHADFYDSLISKYPRRTCDAVWSGVIDLAWPPERPIPRDADWCDLRSWYAPAVEIEMAQNTKANGIGG